MNTQQSTLTYRTLVESINDFQQRKMRENKVHVIEVTEAPKVTSAPKADSDDQESQDHDKEEHRADVVPNDEGRTILL